MGNGTRLLQGTLWFMGHFLVVWPGLTSSHIPWDIMTNMYNTQPLKKSWNLHLVVCHECFLERTLLRTTGLCVLWPRNFFVVWLKSTALMNWWQNFSQELLNVALLSFGWRTCTTDDAVYQSRKGRWMGITSACMQWTRCCQTFMLLGKFIMPDMVENDEWRDSREVYRRTACATPLG